ncbi:MAG: diacylglycerol/polyprenol kinase family protein [Candidatus Neomarinimicrobiota bacterium]
MTVLPASNEGGRKLIHLGSSVLPLGYWIIGRDAAIVALIVLTVLMLAIEAARMNSTWGRALYQRFLGSVTRPSEERRPTGATYVFIGALVAAILFTPTIAILSMLFMSIGDTAASLVGQRYGRIRIGDKSLEGTLACFLTCLLLALLADLTWPVTLAGAATAALAELIPWPLVNDNTAIPVLSGGAMTLLTAAGL